MILSVTLPFFALIFLGFVAARLRWVPTEAVPAFNGFLLYFAVPAMLFRFAAIEQLDLTSRPAAFHIIDGGLEWKHHSLQ